MENRKVCPNCGIVNTIDSQFCSNCGVQLTQNNVVVNNQKNNDTSEGNKLGLLSLILYFLGTSIVSVIAYALPTAFRNYLSTLSGLFPLAGIVIMIVGRVKYPNNKLLKAAMWAIIGSIIFSLIAFIVFFIWCYVTCTTMDTSGCN